MARRRAVCIVWCLVVGICEVCAQSTDVCQPNPCEEGGFCFPFPDRNDFVCVCPLGFLGKTCNIEENNPVDPCQLQTCGHLGICIPLEDSFFCICRKGFGGTTCEDPIDEDAMMTGSTEMMAFTSTMNASPGDISTEPTVSTKGSMELTPAKLRFTSTSGDTTLYQFALSTNERIEMSLASSTMSRTLFSTNPTETSSTLSFTNEIEILLLKGNIGDSTVLRWYYDDDGNGCLLFFKLEVMVPQEDGWIHERSISSTERYTELTDVENRNISSIRIVAVVSLEACGNT